MKNKKIVDYRMIVKGGFVSLESAVKLLIMKGWQPYGNPSMRENPVYGQEKEAAVQDDNDFEKPLVYMQALVMYEL